MLSDQFQQRIKEIDAYYAFLDQIASPKADFISKINDVRVRATINSDLVRILKANAFLLLYNLVESSIREGITYIYDSLQSDGLTYKDLRVELRQIWVMEAMNPETDRAPENIVALVQGLIQSSLEDAAVEFDPKHIPISGNLDARKVRELATRYGFAHSAHRNTRGGEVLLRVKTERNNLAHGNVSFVECGRDITYPSLKKTKTQLVMYVGNILDNIEAYVTNKAYRQP